MKLKAISLPKGGLALHSQRVHGWSIRLCKLRVICTTYSIQENKVGFSLKCTARLGTPQGEGGRVQERPASDIKSTRF